MVEYEWGIKDLIDLKYAIRDYAERMFGNSDVRMNPADITERGKIKTEISEN